MRVDGFQNIPALLQSFNANKASKPNTGTSEDPPSTVSLSPFAELLQSLQRDSTVGENNRSAKVNQLAKQQQDGNLSVDVTNLAAKLVDLRVIEPKG